MTYLRRKGLEVEGRRRGGETYYRILGGEQVQAADSGLFSGISPEVSRCYHNRALVLSAANN